MRTRLSFFDRLKNKWFRRRVLKEISMQIVLENQQPDESYKACISALYQLQKLVIHFPQQSSQTAYKMSLLQEMHRFQKDFKPVFTDNYASAKATLGSVLRRLEED